MPLCSYYPGVRIKQALRENVRNTCFIDIKTKADSFTNQGSVEVYMERQEEVLVWKYHVFTFLLATTQQYERRMILVQLAASKQRLRGRRLRAMTGTKSQGSETCVTGGRKLYWRTIRSTRVKHRKKDRLFKIKYVTLLCYCFFFSTVIKFYSPVKICHYLNRVQCLQLSHNCDNENRQCADNQCP